MQSNQIASTLVIVPLFGFIVSICRTIPLRVFNFIRGQFITCVTIYGRTSQESFLAMDIMFATGKFKSFTRQYMYSDTRYSDAATMTAGLSTMFYGIYNGVFITAVKVRDTDNKFETSFIYHINFYTKNIKKVSAILNIAYANKDNIRSDTVFNLMIPDRWGSGWVAREKAVIPISKCTLQQQEIIRKIDSTINDEHFEKFGALLYGAPGCGKTKLIEALASYTNRRLYYFNISQMSEQEFMQALSSVKQPSILLFEDIDCTKSTNSRTKKSSDEQQNNSNSDDTSVSVIINAVSLSTLLNVFDGVLSINKQLVIATTNHPEKLDAALHRKGRFDMSIELFPVKKEEVAEIISAYFKTTKDVVLATGKLDQLTEIPVANVYAACKMSDTIDEAIDLLFDTSKIFEIDTY